ncbi:site-specific integrase [Ectobacillus ponti]|uniref:Site-specific integrase n=1 Tax=Ectobacillus ponti TaxID=2961894 RepID=A0AA42BR11_9BACI|nr:site-specific integrase [Ectobacillus ponti]MCP8970467.1 site-specific integrase [Ectobacillus ponti]
MGSVKKDGSTWYFVAELGTDPLTGKRKRKKQRGFKTKRDAEKALALVEAEVLKGTYFEPSSLLYQDHLREWFKVKKNSINIQTAEAYEGYIQRRVLPVLGHIPLAQLSPMLLQGYVSDLTEEGLASETVKKLYNIISNSLEHAVNMELLPSNPAKKIQLPKSKKKEMAVWDVEEIQAFLKVAREDRSYIAFHLAITTGMRRGEILGLRWKDVDLEKGMLYVRQTLSKDGKTFLTGAKTDSSVRSIKLSQETIAALKKHKARVASERLKGGAEYSNYDLVVCTAKGTPMNPENLKRTFIRLTKQADVSTIRFHDLRHTHATMLLAQGVHAKVISERLGHSNIKTTLDIYSHVLPSMQEEAANQIDALLAKTT